MLFSFSPIKVKRSASDRGLIVVKLFGRDFWDVEWTDAFLIVWVSLVFLATDQLLVFMQMKSVTTSYYFASLGVLIIGILGLLRMDKHGINFPVTIGVIVASFIGADQDFRSLRLVDGTAFTYVMIFVFIYKFVVEPLLQKMMAARSAPQVQKPVQAAPVTTTAKKEDTSFSSKNADQSAVPNAAESSPIQLKVKTMEERIRESIPGDDELSQVLRSIANLSETNLFYMNKPTGIRAKLQAKLAKINALQEDLHPEMGPFITDLLNYTKANPVTWEQLQSQLDSYISTLNSEKAALVPVVAPLVIEESQLDRDVYKSNQVSLDDLNLLIQPEEAVREEPTPPVVAPAPIEKKPFPQPMFNALKSIANIMNDGLSNSDKVSPTAFYGIIKGYFANVPWPEGPVEKTDNIYELVMRMADLLDEDRNANLRDIAHKSARQLALGWDEVPDPNN
jgi:hypothetical protein